MQACASINTISSGYVKPVGIYVVPYECVEPCDAFVAITWLNFTDVVKSFTPGVILDGVLYTFSPRKLAGGGGIDLGFDILGLSDGLHTIQPFPNGERYIETVKVYPPYR